MMMVFFLLACCVSKSLCFISSTRSHRISIQETWATIWSAVNNNLDDEDDITVIRLDNTFDVGDHSLVAACEFSETFGTEHEILTIDGDRIMYRNGNFSGNQWIPHYGRPIPYSYNIQVPFLDQNSDDLVIDKSGFAWRADHVLRSKGMMRHNLVPISTLMMQEQNISIPTPWHGPMDIPPEDRGLGINMKLREDEAFRGSLLDDERWMVYYTKLSAFLTRFGHTDVPLDWKDDPPLSRWVLKQRTNYRKYARNNFYQYEIDEEGDFGRKITELTPWRIQMLYDLGFSFKIKLSWDDRYKQLLEYHMRYGNIEISPGTMDEDDEEFPGMYLWVQCQRTEYRNFQGGMQSTMTSRRSKLLDALDMNWNPSEKAWMSKIDDLTIYRKKNGHLRIKPSENFELAIWLKYQRQQYKIFQTARWESRLVPERVRQLNDLGMDWDPLEARWQWNVDALTTFAAEHGHCQVPVAYQRDPHLAIWVRKQREAKRKRTLKPAREAQLMSLGFVFETYNELFERGFGKLRSYQGKHGDCAVPLSFHDSELVGFVVNQRSQYREKRKGKTSALTDERQERLEELGFIWNVDVNLGAWDDGFGKLKEFAQLNGDANVPSNYIDAPLYRFVNTQRTEYRKLVDGKMKSSLTPQRISKLEEIGFVWNTNDARWVERYNDLKAYKSLHGTCNVPDKYELNQTLATWVRNQRTQYRKAQNGVVSTMTNGRIELLESVGFEWSVRKRNEVIAS